MKVDTNKFVSIFIMESVYDISILFMGKSIKSIKTQ